MNFPVLGVMQITCKKTDHKKNIGKTDRTLGTRIKEHCGLDKNPPVFNHLAECNFYQYTLTLHSFPCDGDLILTNQDILGHIRKQSQIIWEL